MELLYPGYQSYFNRFLTKPFQTEYNTRYCRSNAPVLYSQVPKYTWLGPRRPTVASKYELGDATKLTYLRPPFAARMTSYEPEQKYLGRKIGGARDSVQGRNSSLEGKGYHSTKLPYVPSGGSFIASTPKNGGSPCEKVDQDSSSHESSSSEPVQPLSRMIYSHSATGSEKYPHVTTSSREKASAKFSLSRDKNILGRVAPRSSTLLSKHPKDVRYVRDTCFFQPTLERKKHYYIVNPNWFSEQRVTVPKNNVFS